MYKHRLAFRCRETRLRRVLLGNSRMVDQVAGKRRPVFFGHRVALAGFNCLCCCVRFFLDSAGLTLHFGVRFHIRPALGFFPRGDRQPYITTPEPRVCLPLKLLKQVHDRRVGNLLNLFRVNVRPRELLAAFTDYPRCCKALCITRAEVHE